MRRGVVLGVMMVLAACGGGERPGSPGDEAQVPPDDAGPVEIVALEIVAGSDGASLMVDGTQPTPCHELGWIVRPDGRIEVTIWSVPPAPDVVCAQVIEPFRIEIDLGPAVAGTEVVVNGEVAGTVG